MAKSGNSTGITPKQATFIAALLAGHNTQVAAKCADVPERTAHRWLTLPHFQTAFKAAQKQVFDQALAGLMLKVEKAIETLDRNLDGDLVPNAVQVRSAQIILDQAIKVHQIAELEQRVAELEELLKESGAD